jgi:ABC-type antimicrobial peptide transport system permease subunit
LAFLNYFIISQSDFSSRNKQFGLIKLFSNSIIEIVKTIFLENFIFSFFALILAYISLFIAKSSLGSLYQFELFDTESILLVILILLILNIISTFLISFKIYKRPLAEILKANKSAGVASGFYRQTVLCFQLIVSLAFIIFSIGNNAKYENTRNQKLSYRNTEQFFYEKKNLDQYNLKQYLEDFHKNSKIISSQLVNKNQLVKSLKSENYNLKSLNLDKFASNSEFLLIKVHTEKIASTLSFLKSELDNYPKFANPKLEKYLMNEQKISDILFVIICIFLFNSFLSLISTLKFIIDKRRKEIVIRKIYGAKIFDIQKLIFSELNVIIFVAIILSWMCAFFPLNSKLDSFSGNVGLRFEYFYMPSIAVFIVANFTILIQTFVYIRKLPLKLIKS